MNFGEACHGVSGLETAMGSTPSGGDEDGSLYTFRGLSDGWPVVVGYWCRDGRFWKGVYMMDRTSLAEATGWYVMLKRKLMSEYDAPTTDLASPELRQRLEETLGHKVPDTDTYSCVWEKQNVGIQLSMNGPFGGEGWQTSVTFESRKKI